VDRSGVLRPLDRLHDLNSTDTLADYDYALPPELIAQQPLATRSASRLLQVDRHTGAHRDLHMPDLPSLLEPGDLLVFNDTRVIPARVQGSKPTGGRVEIFLERILDDAAGLALVQLRTSKAVHPGQVVRTAAGEVVIGAQRDAMWEIRAPLASCAVAVCRCRPTFPGPPTTATASAISRCSRASLARWRRRRRACTSMRNCWRRWSSAAWAAQR
jgi:S-adenosylmethionine:tRNA ribosyltransferase-isomerase